MNFPFAELPRPQTPPSPTTYRSEPQTHLPSLDAYGSQTQGIPAQDLANMEHQFLYYPPEPHIDDSLTFDTSAVSNADSSLNTPAGDQQPLPLILSTPPSSLSQDTFSLGPALQETLGNNGTWQFATPNLDQIPPAMWSDDFSKHRGASESSPFSK